MRTTGINILHIHSSLYWTHNFLPIILLLSVNKFPFILFHIIELEADRKVRFCVQNRCRTWWIRDYVFGRMWIFKFWLDFCIHPFCELNPVAAECNYESKCDYRTWRWVSVWQQLYVGRHVKIEVFVNQLTTWQCFSFDSTGGISHKLRLQCKRKGTFWANVWNSLHWWPGTGWNRWESSRPWGQQPKWPDSRKCWAGSAILQVVRVRRTSG